MKSIPDDASRYAGSPGSRPKYPRRARAIPSTEYRSGRFGKMSNVMTSPSTPSGPAPMNVIRSTHSSRLSLFPSNSMRSPCGTSTFVKDAADEI